VTDLLQASTHRFYVGGSRYHGKNKPDSDLDLYCEDSKEVQSFITGIGFSEYFYEDYNEEDPDSPIKVDVWKHADCRLDILLSNRVPSLLAVHRVLHRTGLYKKLYKINKDDRKIASHVVYWLGMCLLEGEDLSGAVK
jgi:hypothetical protein